MDVYSHNIDFSATVVTEEEGWDSEGGGAELEVRTDKLPEGWIEFEKTKKAYGMSYNLKCHFCPEHSGADKE